MKTLMISTVAVLFAGTAMAGEANLKWDTNNDGMISAEEYAAAENRDMVFKTWDTNGDGVLSAEEFAAGKWQMFDQDADNEWNKAEATMFMDAARRSGADFSDATTTGADVSQ